MWKNKKIIIPVLIIVLVGAAITYRHRPQDSEYITAKVSLGRVERTVEVTGAVASSQSIELNFKTVGRLKNLYVDEGDRVYAGQKLANLDTAALYSRVKDAQSALLEAQANLEKLIAGARPEDIQVTEETVKQRQAAVEAAENSLANLELQAQTDIAGLKKTVVINLHNQLAVAAAALQEIDRVLNDDDAQDTLGALDSNSLNVALNSQTEAENSFNVLRPVIESVNEQTSSEKLSADLNDFLNVLAQIRQALDDTFTVLQKTITSQKFTQSELDSFISAITAKQTSVASAISALHSAQSAWINKQSYYQDQITRAQDNLKAAQTALQLAQAQLKLKTAPPRTYDIKSAQAKVARAQAALNLAQANLNDAIIYAPVDGVIAKINYDIGEQTTLAKPVIEMIGDSPLEVDADVPESDIAAVKLGQKVEITLDAFGDDKIFTGVVTFIDPAETVIQDVVYYQIKIQFKNLSKELQEQIKPGMTANATIIVQRKENVLRVPVRAIEKKDGEYTAKLLTANKKISVQPVKIGLQGDEYYEVLQGLKAGDEVVTFIKTKK